MFDLKNPCKDCPFRRDKGRFFGLPRARLEEIRRAPAFQCHKTVDYDEFEDEERRQGDAPQQCAGLIAVLHREGEPNQIMQVGERLSGIDFAGFDPRDEAFTTWEEVLDAHRKGRGR